ncbi:methyltransferase domain-containing protein [Hymenobacter crusticola]|uniref:SAM-dependent methyltransferase n=1 Tax=Hymenobacter crusticola TaxID=1770526 RepID=A0A243WC26_9BACT|nr:methyltransferase domain-containing protein [Hymenobacter crusticola]OUJ72936.1 SAM-dependent methyltransferase [Hymenobacter crusticola]
MYTTIKQAVKTVVTKQALFKYEPFFRFLLYQLYKGTTYQCVVCAKKSQRFIALGDDKLCAYCGSLARDRRLWSIISGQFIKAGTSILDFSPSRSLYRILKQNTTITYASTDLSGDFISDFQYDITQIDEGNERYDLILCYHILEHIEQDMVAMQELYRVLKKGGSCIVQTPFKEGDIYENYSIKTEKARLLHFGQEDHVRIYSVNGLVSRLTQCGFNVELREYTEAADNYFGFKPNEKVLICMKE